MGDRVSRFEEREVCVRDPAGERTVRCLWVPRSGGKVLVLWPAGSAQPGDRVESQGQRYRVEVTGEADERFERATLAVEEEAQP